MRPKYTSKEQAYPCLTPELTKTQPNFKTPSSIAAALAGPN